MIDCRIDSHAKRASRVSSNLPGIRHCFFVGVARGDSVRVIHVYIYNIYMYIEILVCSELSVPNGRQAVTQMVDKRTMQYISPDAYTPRAVP